MLFGSVMAVNVWYVVIIRQFLAVTFYPEAIPVEELRLIYALYAWSIIECSIQAQEKNETESKALSPSI